MQVARIYLRVSTDGQDLRRQEQIIEDAKESGYYVAGVYREKASGARPDRPELLRMIDDLQPDEVVIAEKIDRISRLPLEDAERLVATIRDKGARLAIPGVVDLSEISAEADGVAKVVLESVQDMLLRVALQVARDDYEDRRTRQQQGIELARQQGKYRGRRPNCALHDALSPCALMATVLPRQHAWLGVVQAKSSGFGPNGATAQNTSNQEAHNKMVEAVQNAPWEVMPDTREPSTLWLACAECF